MFGNLCRCLLSWCKDSKNRSIKAGITLLVVIAGCVLLGMDVYQSATQTMEAIERNKKGQGSKTEELLAQMEDAEDRIPVEIEIGEQTYSDKEAMDMLGRVSNRMDALILGGNESLDRVEKNLNLLTQIPDEPVEVVWELDRYDVINVRGEIQEETLDKEGTVVQLQALLTYTQNRECQARYQCAVCVYPPTLSKQGELEQEVEETLKTREENTRSDAQITLPDSIQGKKTTFYKKLDLRGLVLIIMGVLIGVLLFALEKQNQAKAEEEKRQQMLRDYPEIVNKITLFLGAGMTMKRAWKKIVEDYERQKEQRGIRYAYEEMVVTLREMDSGVTESQSYENFGRRCQVQAYVRLGALLSQNLRKGVSGLGQLLKVESIQAFEERKAQARRAGEEAGTKLLLPMFLMLAVVLVMVIVPAFMTMQM